MRARVSESFWGGDPLKTSNMAGQHAHSGVRYYENEFPEVEEAVMVNVKRIAEMGAYVTVSFSRRF